ncbi:ATP-binding protein [Sphingomonas sp. Leaf198]|uniref:ATP-binding protein n=1 Tax=Sphingomonas sp. Leaf198 TaxID=1736299 RepID=UPI000A559ACC|nr:ATP-binding protein [Sphingomonas sp. Leaf198]
MASEKDPLGRMPRPLTGRFQADYADKAVQDRVANVTIAVDGIWVTHRPQEAIVGRVLTYRLGNLGRVPKTMDGLCMGQQSQSAKSSTMERVKQTLMQEAIDAGEEPNPFQTIIVGLDQKTSLKSVMQDVLIEMKDPDWDYGTEKQLKQRIKNFVPLLGVELIIIDECQHLGKGTKSDDDKAGVVFSDVTDALKRLLDLKIAPIVLVGNEDAAVVFKRNQQLRVRLGLPLELPALRTALDPEAILLRDFITAFATQLKTSGAVAVEPNFTHETILDGIIEVAGGYVGRIARFLKNAAIHASARDAVTVEPYDLSCVTRGYAIDSKWITTDPFSKPHGKR